MNAQTNVVLNVGLFSSMIRHTGSMCAMSSSPANSPSLKVVSGELCSVDAKYEEMEVGM